VLIALVERVLERHKPEWSERDQVSFCKVCTDDWPCDAFLLAEAVRDAVRLAMAGQEMVAALKGLHDLGAFADFEQLFPPEPHSDSITAA